MNNRSDIICYKIGAIAWIPAIVLVWGLYWFEQITNLTLPACQFQQLAHIPCPGCGGTRAFRALLTGHPVESFFFHPAALYIALAYLHFMALCSYHKFVKKDWAVKEIPIEPYFYGLIAVCLIQWVIKLFLIFFQ